VEESGSRMDQHSDVLYIICVSQFCASFCSLPTLSQWVLVCHKSVSEYRWLSKRSSHRTFHSEERQDEMRRAIPRPAPVHSDRKLDILFVDMPRLYKGEVFVGGRPLVGRFGY
jgi:hypothetical protein